MALLIISIILCIAPIVGFFYYFHQFKKERNLLSFNKKYFLVFIGCIGAFTAFSIMAGFGVVLTGHFDMSGGYIALLFFSCLLFGVSFMGFLETFVIYFYKPELVKQLRKYIKITMITASLVAILTFVLSLDCYAPYIQAADGFPLISGFEINENGFNWVVGHVTPTGFGIKWYGVIILIGAIIAYVVCDHHFYQEFKRHGLIDTLFILVFLIGILGARIWAVYVLPTERGVDFWDFQSGGLGIMGGVLFGAVAGIAYLAIFRRYINLRHAMDLILPCVLIAQAIGRWGNFFNQEVYGVKLYDETSLKWLPSFVWMNMNVDGDYRVPLFFYEFLINLAGYFVIVYGVGKGLKKHTSFGDLFCLYLVWYGLTRIILEPLRSSTFENTESIITAWVMFGGGLAGILGLHLYDYFRWGKRTFMLKDDIRLHSPRNPYYIRENENH